MTVHQPNLKAQKITGGVRGDTRRLRTNVTGDAIYIDDMPEPAGTPHRHRPVVCSAWKDHQARPVGRARHPAWLMC